MGMLQSHLSAVSQSQSFGEDTDPGGILSRLWLQPKVRHYQTQRSRTPIETSPKAPAAFAYLHLSSSRDPASRLGGSGYWSVRLKALLPRFLHVHPPFHWDTAD